MLLYFVGFVYVRVHEKYPDKTHCLFIQIVASQSVEAALDLSPTVVKLLLLRRPRLLSDLLLVYTLTVAITNNFETGFLDIWRVLWKAGAT